MGRLVCYCFDKFCRSTAPRISTDGQGGSRVIISRSVGQGGKNDHDDVVEVQRGLNAIPPAKGGPVIKLELDGKVGPLTVDAISKFQRINIGFVDGLVERDKRTIQALNRLLVATPSSFTVTDEMMQATLPAVVMLAQACVKAALTTLKAARVPDTIPMPAQSLVRKHFALQITDPLPPDFALIERIFRKINQEMSLAVFSPGATFVKFPFTLSRDEMNRNHTLALSMTNGVTGRGQTVKLDSQDGKTSVDMPMDAVVLAPWFFQVDQDFQIDTLIHELAHFVGPSDASDDEIGDPPGNSSDDASIAQLSPEQRPRIAEVYSQFAFEAFFSRPLVRRIPTL